MSNANTTHKGDAMNLQNYSCNTLPLNEMRDILTRATGASYADKGEGYNVMLLGSDNWFEDFDANYKLLPTRKERAAGEFHDNLFALYCEIVSRDSETARHYPPWLLILNRDYTPTPEDIDLITQLKSPKAAALGCSVFEVAP